MIASRVVKADCSTVGDGRTTAREPLEKFADGAKIEYGRAVGGAEK